MKLISLNIWGGLFRKLLLEFIQRHQDVDVICLQEVYHNAQDKFSTDDKEAALNIFSEIGEFLTSHRSFFRPVIGNISGNAYGIATFVKKDIDVVNEGDIIIHPCPDYPTDAPSRKGPLHPRNLQWLQCTEKGKTYTIINIHGLWNGKGKSDTPERIAQSTRIRRFMDEVKTPKIVCGDFNLRPETSSLALVKHGMCDLIEKYQVPTTRTSLYSKRQEQPFADYVFTCPKIQIKGFQVLPDEVSDHSPLLLDFDISH